MAFPCIFTLGWFYPSHATVPKYHFTSMLVSVWLLSVVVNLDCHLDGIWGHHGGDPWACLWIRLTGARRPEQSYSDYGCSMAGFMFLLPWPPTWWTVPPNFELKEAFLSSNCFCQGLGCNNEKSSCHSLGPINVENCRGIKRFQASAAIHINWTHERQRKREKEGQGRGHRDRECLCASINEVLTARAHFSCAPGH